MKVELKGTKVGERIVVEDPTEIHVMFHDRQRREYNIKIITHSKPDAPEVSLLYKAPGDTEYEALESVIL